MAKPDFRADDPRPDWKYETKPFHYGRPDDASVVWRGQRHGVVRVARADRRLAQPEPEAPTQTITGRYQNAAAAGRGAGPAFLLHVNQAGKHIEALLVRASESSQSSESPKASAPIAEHRLGGDLRGGRFILYDADGNSGALQASGPSTVTVDYAPASLIDEPFIMREQRPTFLDDALEPLIALCGDGPVDAQAARQTLEETERTPLTDAQMAFIADALAANKVLPFVARYHQHASSLRSAERALAVFAADALEQYLAGVVADRRWPRQPMAGREYARAMLAVQTVTVGHSLKSLGQWLEDLTVESLGAIPGIGLSPGAHPLTTLRWLLGVAEGHDVRRIGYHLELDLTRKGFKGWGKARAVVYAGTMGVRSAQASSFRGALVEYGVVLVGVGLVLDRGGGDADIKGSADFATFGEWTPADFVGSIKLLEGSLWAGQSVLGKKVGRVAGDVAVVLGGRGNHPDLIVPLPGFGPFRQGIGAEFSISVGRVLENGRRFETKDFARPQRRALVPIGGKREGRVHFDLGSALLKGLGRQAVRICAAKWLPWLASKESALRIVGQADTVDLPARNQELSQLRARNVQQALVDILGGELAIPSERLEVRGIGDVQAAMVDRDETPDRQFRRVDMELNGRSVLVLWSS
jgi:outer membrane protein OmpA-like peptidoglycan-associated protein